MVKLPVFNRNESYEVNPTKIVAIGKNYREHIAESHTMNVQGFNEEIPAEPILFPKTPNVLIGTDEPIIIPKFINEYHFEDPQVDYEGELAFIFKDKCKNISRVNALKHILGFTCMNDVSQRNFQRTDRSGWYRGKSLDTFGPIGPQLVMTEDIEDPMNLNIQTRLNGEIVQDGNTSQMIFGIPELVAFITKNFTMKPGDIVSTGTPGGVGRIVPGDVVEIEIEKIGILRNPVIEEGKK
jgi:2-keto-4-pentenoate hydratase/2-oxohepta-3-ene-1,7-dioic acid hydratase in catechol pathway